MKKLVVALGITIGLLSCQSDISPKKLIGEWSPTYEMQQKENGKWGKWVTINTLMAIPNIEFKASGAFLRDGKPGAECCSAGNKYTVKDKTIFFSDLKDCPNVSCVTGPQWTIYQLDSKVMVIGSAESRSKYLRVK